MTSKKLIKAFIAGMAFPALIVPIAYTLIYLNFNRMTQHTLPFLPMFLPLVWGLANAILIKVQEEAKIKKPNNALIVTGLVLGLLVALFGVYVVHIPAHLFGTNAETVQYVPLIVVPIVYAFLFRYVVKWINKLVGV